MNPQNDENEDALSPLAIGTIWSSRVMTIAVKMGLIVFGGNYLDNRFGTKPLFLLIASLLALTILFVDLATIVREEGGKKGPKSEKLDNIGEKNDRK